MKKINIFKQFFIILLLIVYPLNIFAYSDYIIPGGENIGIEINSDGLLIVGFYKVGGKYNKGNPSLEVGDRIIEVNGLKIKNVQDLLVKIEENVKNNKIELKVLRENTILNTTLTLELIDGVYKTGIYVKDTLTGIGTLTYIDPQTKIYGTLGHEITEKVTNSIVEVKDGIIFKSRVTGIDRSTDGTPGGKLAKFYYNTKYGSVIENTNSGVFGVYETELPLKELLKVGQKEDVKLGKAKIMTVIDNEEIKEYEIDITKINDSHKTKNIVFKIIDKELLSKAGGIVQGMSGSPIIQNKMIIGAVTHVIVDDVKKGYGIFITTMLEEGEN